MQDLSVYLDKAQKGGFALTKLNFFLGYIIPFNRPHGIKIAKVSDEEIITYIPYKRKNFNHIRGVHACGMATAAEFASGLMLLYKLGAEKYRIIMKTIEVEYHYQAKTDIIATFKLDEATLNRDVIEVLKTEDAAFIKCEINLHDANKNHVATTHTYWQIKSWDKVKTKK